MSAGITVTKDGIRKDLEAKVARTKTVAAFLQRHTYNQYRAAQAQRWITENASQGSTWERVSPAYQTYKKKKFATYEFAGRNLMVATGGLYRAATGRGPGVYKLISDTQFVVGIDLGASNPDGKRLDYASYAAEVRPIMEFSDFTIKQWTDDITQYIAKGRK